MIQFFISATHKSSGKTTLSIGLCAAFKHRGFRVQTFKKGPDYIDPMWLRSASGRPCYNLDFNTMDRNDLVTTYAHRAAGADIIITEGNKGLYDGLDLHGSNSNAALAKTLGLPIVLVVDSQGMTRGIAPLILGYQSFDPNINIAGVILNMLGGSRHESKLRAVIEHYTDVPVLGAVQRDEKLQILQRHLGLIPSNETQETTQHLQQIAESIASQVDLDRLTTLRGQTTIPDESPTQPKPTTDIRIGICKDAAFGFYYQEDLEEFTKAGAELVPINTLSDHMLPKIDGMFIGGGFPETQMRALEQNVSLRHDLAHAVDNGLPIYAECGGLMYLSRRISWQDRTHQMVGAIPVDTVMHKKPQGRGYVRLSLSEAHPWGVTPGLDINAHEFHYSSLENIGKNMHFGYHVNRGFGIDGKNDGLVHNNVFASYAHLKITKHYNWVHAFVGFVRRIKAQTDHVT